MNYEVFIDRVPTVGQRPVEAYREGGNYESATQNVNPTEPESPEVVTATAQGIALCIGAL